MPRSLKKGPYVHPKLAKKILIGAVKRLQVLESGKTS